MLFCFSRPVWWGPPSFLAQPPSNTRSQPVGALPRSSLRCRTRTKCPPAANNTKQRAGRWEGGITMEWLGQAVQVNTIWKVRNPLIHVSPLLSFTTQTCNYIQPKKYLPWLKFYSRNRKPKEVKQVISQTKRWLYIYKCTSVHGSKCRKNKREELFFFFFLFSVLGARERSSLRGREMRGSETVNITERDAKSQQVKLRSSEEGGCIFWPLWRTRAVIWILRRRQQVKSHVDHESLNSLHTKNFTTDDRYMDTRTREKDTDKALNINHEHMVALTFTEPPSTRHTRVET